MKTSKLEKLREQIAAVKGEIREIERARLTTPEIEARVDGFIQEMKDQAEREILDSAVQLTRARGRDSEPGNWPAVHIWVRVRPQMGFSMAVTLNPEAFRAMALKAALKALNGERQEHEVERRELVAELRENLRLLEQDEEAEVLQLEELGINVRRRGDADPAVVLGLVA